MSETKIDISRASKAIRDSRFVEALSMLESNLAKDPDHLESLYFAAVCSRSVSYTHLTLPTILLV